MKKEHGTFTSVSQLNEKDKQIEELKQNFNGNWYISRYLLLLILWSSMYTVSHYICLMSLHRNETNET